jgi:hypothetical protein
MTKFAIALLFAILTIAPMLIAQVEARENDGRRDEPRPPQGAGPSLGETLRATYASLQRKLRGEPPLHHGGDTSRDAPPPA